MADVKIDYDAVNSMGDAMGRAADIVQTLDVVFTALASFLIATGFGAPIGAKYMVRKPTVIQIIQKCQALDNDLHVAVQAIQNGDAQGSQKFM